MSSELVKQLHLTGKLFLILAIIVIWLQALHGAWIYHLQADTALYFERTNYFAQHLSFKELDHNEWQPVATLYYIAPFPILSTSLASNNPYQTYLYTFFGINIFMIFLLAVLYKKLNRATSLLAFALILIFTGPILLFRFELFVGLLTILSYYLWTQKRFGLSSLVLGVGMMTKVYPVILLPYYLILAYKTDGLKQVIKLTLLFLLGVIGVTIFYMAITQVPLSQILEGFAFHAHKPVHVDSVWGSIITITNKLLYGEYAKGAGAWGIFGIASEYTLLPLQFFNYFWVLPISILYLWLFKISQKNSILNPMVFFLLILVFLVTGKSVAPQYLIWFMVFYPLINPFANNTFRSWIIDLFLILLICFLTQFIYPLKYTELVSNFYIDGSHLSVFWIYAFNHLLLIILCIRFFRLTRWNLSQSH